MAMIGGGNLREVRMETRMEDGIDHEAIVHEERRDTATIDVGTVAGIDILADETIDMTIDHIGHAIDWTKVIECLGGRFCI